MKLIFADFRFAWRNLWRNKRRTLITVASIFFGVILSTVMSSMQEGSYQMYIKNIVNFYSGYIQIRHPDYWNDKNINNTFDYSDELQKEIQKVSFITATTPRLESFGLAASDEITQGVMVVGIAPDTEDSITRVSSKIKEGKYLSNSDSEVVIGQKLSKLMNLKIHDTIVILSQGYHGASAAGKYAIKGIIKHPSPDLDKSIVYMSLPESQKLFGAENKITSLVVMIPDNDKLEAVNTELHEILKNNYGIVTWVQMNRLLLKQIESDRDSGLITKGILYMIVAFGIFGTVMMMIAERKKEFGVLIAIGMQKSKLSTVLFFETILIGMIGVATGIISSIPIVFYFAAHPIPLTGQAAQMVSDMGFEPVMGFATQSSIFYSQAVIIFVFCSIISTYPILKTKKLNIMSALRS